MSSVNDVLEKLTARDFDGLLGVWEGVWLAAKELPYLLETLEQEMELAKDISALANAEGGIIMLGFGTKGDPLHTGRKISQIRHFPLGTVQADRYQKIVHEYVYPPLDISVNVFEEADGNGVAAIVISGANSKPYIVGKTIQTHQNIGAYFGFFERKQDLIPPVSIVKIQQQLAAGQQWASIDQILQAIESNICGWEKKYTEATEITAKERKERLTAARTAIERNDAPVVYFMASAEGECDFPTLFGARDERVVGLIEKPPQFRPKGFGISAGDTSEIVLKRLRRNLLAGHRLIELWKDGLFIFIAPGDEDFLGWNTHRSDKQIHINSFALAEATLSFCWLMKLIFEEAGPKPSVLRLTVGCDHLTRSSGRPTLNATPEAGIKFSGVARTAPADDFEVYQLTDLADYDVEHMTFLLLEDIYRRFGYDWLSMPYIDRSGLKLKLKTAAIIGTDLPGGSNDG